MKEKKKVSMPGKVGKVGRRRLPVNDKIIIVGVWKTRRDVDLLGGKEEVQRLLGDFFDQKLSEIIA